MLKIVLITKQVPNIKSGTLFWRMKPTYLQEYLSFLVHWELGVLERRHYRRNISPQHHDRQLKLTLMTI
jgi:hypothetical protein